MAWFRRYGLAEKSLFGLPGAPVAYWSPGGQKAHFWAEKWAWRPLEAIPSSGARERKLRAVHTDSMAKVSNRFGPLSPLEDDCTGFRSDCTENTGQNGPKQAIFGCISGFSPPGGLKMGQKLVDLSLYLKD